jgi:hypothetical protein
MEETMAKYLAVFTGQPSGGPPPDEATVARGVQAWSDWMTRHATQVIDSGGPLGKTKRVSPTGIADIHNSMSAYVIIEAADHDAAARIFEGHPHFTVFPGDGVEVMPVLSAPGA